MARTAPSSMTQLSIRSMRLGGSFLRKSRENAPTQTPTAYIEMRRPASGMLTDRAWDTSGRIPIITNSDIPSTKVPEARATKPLFISIIISPVPCLPGRFPAKRKGDHLVTLRNLCAPSGARTLDPNIKSVVLYQLS